MYKGSLLYERRLSAIPSVTFRVSTDKRLDKMIGEFELSRSSTPDSEQDSIAEEINNNLHIDTPTCSDSNSWSAWHNVNKKSANLWSTEINLFDDLDTISCEATTQSKQFDNRPWSVDISELPGQKVGLTAAPEYKSTTSPRRPSSLPLLKCSMVVDTDLGSSGEGPSSSDSCTFEGEMTSRRVAGQLDAKAMTMLDIRRPPVSLDETPDTLLKTPAGFYDRLSLCDASSVSSAFVTIRPLFDQVPPRPANSPKNKSSFETKKNARNTEKLAEARNVASSSVEAGTPCDSSDVDTLDCIRRVLQTILPEEKISLTNDTCPKLFAGSTCNQISTVKCDKVSRSIVSDKATSYMSGKCSVASAKSNSHLNPDAPSFNYHYPASRPATVYVTVPVRITAARPVPMTQLTFATTSAPASMSVPHKSPRLRRQPTATPPGTNVMWRPAPVTVAYAPVYDGWSNYCASAQSAMFPGGLQLCGPVSYYQQPALYVLGHGPVHLMNHNRPLVDRRRTSSGKHTSPTTNSRCAA